MHVGCCCRGGYCSCSWEVASSLFVGVVGGSFAVLTFNSARPVLIAVAKAELIVMGGRLVGTKVGADADSLGWTVVTVSALRSASMVVSVVVFVFVVFVSVSELSVLLSVLKSVLNSESSPQKPPHVVWRIVTAAWGVVRLCPAQNPPQVVWRST